VPPTIVNVRLAVGKQVLVVWLLELDGLNVALMILWFVLFAIDALLVCALVLIRSLHPPSNDASAPVLLLALPDALAGLVLLVIVVARLVLVDWKVSMTVITLFPLAFDLVLVSILLLFWLLQ
jgi:hypothetical protein